MNQICLEELTLFASVGKWAVYASAVGAIVGVSTAFFLKLLNYSIAAIQTIPNYLLCLPLFLLASKLLIERFAPEAAGYGTDRLIAAIHNNYGQVPLAVVPIKLISSILTIAGGGSAGKVGPCGQIGAGLAAALANLLQINKADRQKLVVCGISAGFAAVFGTPIGGAIFGVEVLFLGKLLYDVLFPAFIAGITSYHVAAALGVDYLRQDIGTVPTYSEGVLIEYILLGICCGLIALIFIKFIDAIQVPFSNWHHPLMIPIVGGSILAAIGVGVSPACLGLGVEAIRQGLQGESLPLYTFAGKMLTTAITFAVGGSGGIILPSLFVGTAVGNAVGQLLGGTYLGAYSAAGMVALLAAAANTPIAATIIAIELFGPAIGPYAAISCIVSYLLVGHHSIFPTQILATRKSASLIVDANKPITSITDIHLRPDSAIGKLLARWRRRT